jgi:hypothetical protein
MTVYVMRDGALVEKSKAPPQSGVFHAMRDIAEFRSPVDGSVITSRSQLREHEQRHGVRQVGNDWVGAAKPSWWDAEKHRIQR